MPALFTALAHHCQSDAVTMPALFAALAIVLLFCMVILPDVEHKHYQGDFGKKDSGLVPFDQLTDAQKDEIIW